MPSEPDAQAEQSTAYHDYGYKKEHAHPAGILLQGPHGLVSGKAP